MKLPPRTILQRSETTRMANKADVLMHPVRMNMVQVLFRHKDEGLTPLEMVKILKDVPQATLYRHLQKLIDAHIIRVLKEKKVRAVSEKYYTINEDELTFDQIEWESHSTEDKLNYFAFYQILLKSRYEDYLNKTESKGDAAHATFSISELQLGDDTFHQFQNELRELILHYHEKQGNEESDAPHRTVGITIVPET